MTATCEFKRQGAKKIAELFLWHTAGINHLDEQIARQQSLGRDIRVSSRVRRRICDAFAVEVEDLKHAYGIAQFSGLRS